MSLIEKTMHFSVKFRHLALGLLTAALLASCGKKDNVTKEIMGRYAKEKEKEARELSQAESDRWPVEFERFFMAAESGNWDRATNIYATMQNKYGMSSTAPSNGWSSLMQKTYAVGSEHGITPTNYWPNPYGLQWRPIDNTYWTIRQFQSWDPELMRLYATNVLKSISPDGIFLAGTEASFFVVPAINESLTNRKAITIISPNKLADGTYLEYLSHRYSHSIKAVTSDDSSVAFSAYIVDLQERAKQGRLLPGENASTNGVVTGVASVTQINTLLLKAFVAKNPGREIFFDEQLPMYPIMPHLVPAGMISRVSPTPLAHLDPSVVGRDHAYWQKLVYDLTGIDAKMATPVKEFLEIGEKVYWRKDLRDFKGDHRYATNDFAQFAFAEARVNIARIYAWRSINLSDAQDHREMTDEADFAFRQVMVLDRPEIWAPEYGYFLSCQRRTNDLQLLVEGIRGVEKDATKTAYLSNLLNALHVQN